MHPVTRSEGAAAPSRLIAEPVGSLPGRASESPFWDDLTGCLVWVETAAGEVHRWSPSTGETRRWSFPGEVGCAVPRREGGFMVAVDNQILCAEGDDHLELVANVPDEGGNVRFNDGRCDRFGRLWIGTMTRDLAPGCAALFCLVGAHDLRLVVDSVGLANGIGWSPDGSDLYFIDSLARRTDRYPVIGPDELGRPTLFARIQDDGTSEIGMTVPDGLAVDAAGNVWIAVFGAGEVRGFDAAGRLHTVVEVGHPAVTSCAFGGASLDMLFITTGAEHDQHVYACRTGTQGILPTPCTVAPCAATSESGWLQ